MSPIGHSAIALAAKPLAARVPLGYLILASVSLDVLTISFAFAGIEGSTETGFPWSHGLLMSLIWSVLASIVTIRVLRDSRAGIIVGLLVFSHWILDFISHPIPFPSFSWSSWQWTYGHPLPSDLPLLFGGSPRVGLGLYNSISAVEATLLEVGMFILGTLTYVRFTIRQRRGTGRRS